MNLELPTAVEEGLPPLEMRPTACASCGARVTGVVCGSCGQRVLPRVTLRSLAGRLSDRVLRAATSFLRTTGGLLLRPERAIQDVLDGRTLSYVERSPLSR